jgi:hypothetical protein
VTNPDPLWPANHQYVTISLDDFIEVTDSCSSSTLPPSAYQKEITCVTSDEPDDLAGSSDGNTTNDIVIVDNKTVKIRAERASSRDGRVYTINFRIRDSANNSQNSTIKVAVPRTSKGSAIDSGVANSVCL